MVAFEPAQLFEPLDRAPRIESSFDRSQSCDTCATSEVTNDSAIRRNSHAAALPALHRPGLQRVYSLRRGWRQVPVKISPRIWWKARVLPGKSAVHHMFRERTRHLSQLQWPRVDSHKGVRFGFTVTSYRRLRFEADQRLALVLRREIDSVLWQLRESTKPTKLNFRDNEFNPGQPPD